MTNRFLEDSDDEFEVSSSENEKNYYEILGVEKSSTQNEIKKAYREKAKELHPDKHIDEQDKYKSLFQDLCQAYSILGNPKKREVYDKYGLTGVKQHNFIIPSNEKEFNVLFKMAFEDDEIDKNDKYAKLSKPQCSPILLSIEISVKESINGGKKPVSFIKQVLCTGCDKTIPKCYSCKGKGTKKSKYPGVYKCVEQACVICSGSGKIQLKHNCVKCDGCSGVGTTTSRVMNFDWIELDCDICQGLGRYCKLCNNTSYRTVESELVINIKPGVRNNTKHIIYRKGNEQAGFEPGDIVITYKLVIDNQEQQNETADCKQM